ncbi:MAG: GUN4 domain-containing protein [Cyanobacteria bacterium P01_C01_bin.69]
MTDPSASKPPVADQLAELLRKAIVPGGATVGGIGAFWELFISNEGDVLTAVASAGIGLALSYGAAMLKPFHSANQRRAGHIGDVVNEGTERLFAKATRFEDKYLLCQAWDCESVRSEGVQPVEGIFEPMLQDVFVELQIDSSASFAGFETQLQSAVQEASVVERFGGQISQNIWDLLAESRRQKAFRQMAILAWGGYGKTTLLKHVAYCYCTGAVPHKSDGRQVPELLPVLLPLRKYRQQLVQASPPSLPALINQFHIPSLPESHRLQPVPPNWAKDILQRGKALILFDGFDEVPLLERPMVAKWIHAQMRQYAKSVFVVTSRPKAYKEQDAAHRLTLSMPMWVQPFDEGQRRRFVENWYLCQEKLRTRRDGPGVRSEANKGATDLLQQIEAEEDLRKMAKNPLMLNMIATFHRQNSMAPLPKRQSELYGEICTLQLKDRPRARGLETVLLDMEAQPVLGKVALGMMQKALKRIDRDDLLREMDDALKDHDESVDASAFLKDVVRISEIVVRQEDEYEFAHLSFQEYLAAAYIAAKPEERESILFENLTEDWWKATILLYAGKTKKPASLIKEALRQKASGLAYDCYKQTRKRLDESLRPELEELQSAVKQVKDERYADLARYLQNGQWKAADEEIYRLMITEIGKEKGQFFASDDLSNFPCEPLKVIDGLWVEHSGGKFGFSVQKKIYQECGGVADGQYDMEVLSTLIKKVGWNQPIVYELDETPIGHLPADIYLGSTYRSLFSSDLYLLSSLASRLVNCSL